MTQIGCPVRPNTHGFNEEVQSFFVVLIGFVETPLNVAKVAEGLKEPRDSKPA